MYISSRKEGFTLVEILIVVGIVALLAAIAIPNLLRAKVSANDASAKATLKTIATVLENYYSINNIYPPTTNALLGAQPPYLNTDYFTGTHNGFTYVAGLGSYSYLITAAPISSSQGTSSFTIATGSVTSW